MEGVCWSGSRPLGLGSWKENCSWLPWWLWRLDEEWETFGPWERTKLQGPPSDYFRRQSFISVDVDEFMVKNVIETVGDDNLVLSTDYPHHDSKYPNALDTFLEMDVVPEASQKKIFVGQLRPTLRHIELYIKRGIDGRIQDKDPDSRL